MKGLAPKVSKYIERISRLECLRPYVLVGGTALSLQIGTRESEDLDFMSWRKDKLEKREVDWPTIKKELAEIGKVEKIEIFDLDHVELMVEGVKLSFYANPNNSPLEEVIPFLNNIRLADKKSIGAMKMEVMMRRSKFRDYYDIYSLIKDGQDLKEMIGMALKYSSHKMKSKNLIAMLTRSERFVPDAKFATLNPIYNVTPAEIEAELKAYLADHNF